jgi:ALG6, ALG8 glycosyltransferase family
LLMAWADYAYTHGATRLYDFPRGHPVLVRVPTAEADGWTVRAVPAARAFNYPPFTAYVLWLQGWLWHRLDPDVRPLPRAVAPDDDRAAPSGPVTNTPTARAVNALPGVVADLLMAWGTMLLARGLAGARGTPRRDTAAFALVALAPPMVLISAFWGQIDSWMACALVWALYAATTRRFASAGGLYALALVIKAQAVMFLPVAACVALAPPVQRDAAPARWRALAAAAGAGALVIAVVAGPFTIRTDAPAPHRAFTWVERAYVEPFLEQDPYTTMKAFNLWWLELAARNPPTALIDARTPLLGLPRDAWGRVLVVVGTLLAFGVVVRRFGWGPRAWVALAFLCALTAFVAATRVHERYLYYCLPFLTVSALGFRPWLIPLGGLFVIATFELSWPLWYQASTTVRWLTGGLAASAVLLWLYSLTALIWSAPESVERD